MMRTYVLTLLLTAATLQPALAQPGPLYLKADGREYKVEGRSIWAGSGLEWEEVATFPQPTIPLLAAYRPDVAAHAGSTYQEGTWADAVHDVESEIGTAAVHEGKIWVGFQFYEGEGFEGIGGLGFFDLGTRQVGVLRHPALVDCSADTLLVTEAAVHVKTTAFYELSQGVCNGAVTLDRTTLAAQAVVPPGTSTWWNQDGSENAAAFYNQSLPDILRDGRFVPLEVEALSEAALERVAEVGAEAFMQEWAAMEREARHRAEAEAAVVIDKTIELFAGAEQQRIEDEETGLDFWTGWHYVGHDPCAGEGFAPFSVGSYWQKRRIYPEAFPAEEAGTEVPYSRVRKGVIWSEETAHYTLRVVLEDYTLTESTCEGTATPVPFFTYARLRIQHLELNP